MPIANGDSMEGSVPILDNKILDFKSANQVLQKEYPERDGIDVKTLLDSKLRGGLTYNDFLVLPGYIGKPSPPQSRATQMEPSDSLRRLSCQCGQP